jgi:uncharacterized protein
MHVPPQSGFNSRARRRFVVSVGMTLGLAASPAAQTPTVTPYQEEEVAFTNEDVKLAGTLTMPSTDKPRAAVVLLTGSGAQNRDEELFGFRRFRVIADHLGKSGFAVLRYDDRGVGGSTGSIPASTTHDFARDALAGLRLLKSRLGAGLLGHSEGALAAAIAAAESPDVAFVVWMAGSGERGDAILRRQAEDLSTAAGGSDAVIAQILAAHRAVIDSVRAGTDRASLVPMVRALVRAQLDLAPAAQRQAITDVDAFVNKMAETNVGPMLSAWFRAFVALDPAEALAKVTCPVLALFGERDMQVPPTANRPPVEAALARAKNLSVTIKVYPEANHLFIKSVTGNPSEYPTLDKVFVPGLLDDLVTWLLVQGTR